MRVDRDWQTDLPERIIEIEHTIPESEFEAQNARRAPRKDLSILVSQHREFSSASVFNATYHRLTFRFKADSETETSN